MQGCCLPKPTRYIPKARKILEKKAQQLVGGRVTRDVPAGKNPVKYFMETRRVDVFIGYCSSHETTPDTSVTQVELTTNLAISADYGMTVLDDSQNKSTCDAAYRSAMYLMSPQAQAILPRYGFSAVAMSLPS